METRMKAPFTEAFQRIFKLGAYPMLHREQRGTHPGRELAA